MMAMASVSYRRSRDGERDLERKKGSSTEREGRGFPDRRQSSPFAIGLLGFGCSAMVKEAGFHGGECLQREREWRGSK
jgi:hypothetical protein